jgi:DNA-binding NarL/FixJ family response regulator
MARVRLALVLRTLGEPVEGIEALIDAIPPSWSAPYAVGIARAELAEGRIEAAERLVTRAEAAAHKIGLPWATALAQRGRAAILLVNGDASAAAALALTSAEGAHCAPIAKARSQVLAGRALAVAGERTEAIAALRAAERTFAANGIDHDRDLARRELRKLKARTEPRGPSAPGDSGLASLSTREREVAGLVTARHTNREIAATLFLSEKTVESHLRNSFAKLGASSRVEVARTVERGIREHP